MEIITITKTDAIFPAAFLAIGEECPDHSGTMHTVRFAQTYGKPVRAVRYPVVGSFNTGNALIINSGIGTAL